MNRTGRTGLWLTFLISLPSFLGCYAQKGEATHDRLNVLSAERMAVVGFQAALTGKEEPDVVRDPLSGAVFMAEPVSQSVVQRMTSMLFEALGAKRSYELVSPGQTKGFLSSILRRESNLGLGSVEIIRKVGEACHADTVLIGHLYRWRERKGTDYAVSHPASVAFDLDLVQVFDGKIVWNAGFDKTQQSLTENLFDMRTFLQSGGRWMTAEKLAEIGIRRLLGKMPGKIGAKQE